MTHEVYFEESAMVNFCSSFVSVTERHRLNMTNEELSTRSIRHDSVLLADDQEPLKHPLGSSSMYAKIVDYNNPAGQAGGCVLRAIRDQFVVLGVDQFILDRMESKAWSEGNSICEARNLILSLGLNLIAWETPSLKPEHLEKVEGNCWHPYRGHKMVQLLFVAARDEQDNHCVSVVKSTTTSCDIFRPLQGREEDLFGNINFQMEFCKLLRNDGATFRSLMRKIRKGRFDFSESFWFSHGRERKSVVNGALSVGWERMRNMHIVCNVNVDGPNHISLNYNGINPQMYNGRLGWYHSGDTWAAGLVVCYGQCELAVIKVGNAPLTSGLILLSHVWALQPERMTARKRFYNREFKALNVETKNYCENCNTNITWVQGEKLRGIEVVCDKDDYTTLLVIHEFDNRSHHKIKTLEKLQKHKEFVVVPVDISDEDKVDLRLSSDSPMDRVVLIGGKIYYVTEFSSPELCRIYYLLFKKILPVQMFSSTLQCSKKIMSPSTAPALDQLNMKGKKMWAQVSEFKNSTYSVELDLNKLLTTNELAYISNKLALSKESLADYSSFTWKPIELVEIKDFNLNCLTANDVVGISHHNTNWKTYLVWRFAMVLTLQKLAGATRTTVKSEQSTNPPTDSHWKMEHHKTEVGPNQSNKWGLQVLAKGGKEKDVSTLTDVTAMLSYTPLDFVELITNYEYMEEEIEYAPYIGTNQMYHHLEMPTEPNVIRSEILDIYHQTDLTDWATIYAPVNQTRMKIRADLKHVTKLSKITMTKCPERSRPVLTGVGYEALNMVAGRIFNATNTRKYTMSNTEFLDTFQKVYFKPAAGARLAHFQAKPVTYNQQSTVEWLKKHHKGQLVAKQLDWAVINMQSGGLFNDVNVHEKLESLLKEEPILHMKQGKVRSIMWQNYWVAAIYAPIMIELKNRLIEVLDNKIVYSIGLTPEQISARLRITEAEWIFANDLTQQDRQTDHPMIEKEMMIYRLLGVDEHVLSAYATLHRNWRYKGDTMRGMCDAMRLTGQPSTALGNVIVNLIVHMDLVKRNHSSLALFLCLGDDGTILFKSKPDVGNIKKHTMEHHNMFCKPSLRKECEVFCRLIISRNSSGTWQAGPDYVRLRHRFETTNGVSDLSWTNLHARCMSYMMTLGPTDRMEKLNTVRQYNLPLRHWYEEATNLQAVCSYYSMGHLEVLEELNQLQLMLEEMKVTVTTWVALTSGRPKKEAKPEVLVRLLNAQVVVIDTENLVSMFSKSGDEPLMAHQLLSKYNASSSKPVNWANITSGFGKHTNQDIIICVNDDEKVKVSEMLSRL